MIESTHAVRRSWSRRLATSVASAAYVMLTSHCIVGDDECGPNQVPSTQGQHACVCDAGYILNELGDGCEACGRNEEVAAGKCVCKAGFTRDNEEAVCEKVEGSEVGSDCDESTPCRDPNPYCADEDDSGYCTTSGCSKNDDCPIDWRCDDSGETSYCKKPATGLRDTCQTHDDCSDQEASFCESFQTHMCIVDNCLSTPGVCPSQWVCCVLGSFGQLCVDPGGIIDGKCPGGSAPVTP